MSTQQSQPSERPGRYQRSAVGLVTSLVVTVVAIGGLLYFMGAFRPDFEVKPEAVDYRETVQSAQQAGLTPVYPDDLPKGWISTGVDVTPGDRPVFMVRLLTDEEKFVAVRQEDSSVTAMLARWVDEDTETRDGYTVPAAVPTPVARDWKGYADAGGDSAYAAEVDGQTVLVFGSAPAEDLRAVVDSLVTTPID
ncbi:DUF4245 family protein [Nocardioides daeguensis]|uniref:DUF4245 domain-containing protein n=1 Tax=Nocardioides daeguensis TaxID=908359 RepID=A0ABP6W281_9ACTN|nr:DUF4245 family protein [Nocardioides daeguensis]MBV6727618.1 DUF4245 domain-containing protein [Nocardioides daeguensis]MCR1775090.1 DUF4245 domain-containing protein [Nocardioides daeguensis]